MQQNPFTLQPVILEYVTEQLVALVSDEIRECKPALSLTHAILQVQAKDYLRASQVRLILQPVLDQLISQFGNVQGLEAHLDLLLQHLRELPCSKQGYGGGNVINLLIHLNGHVKGKDCSHLTIWQADLQGAEAQDTVFVGSDLANLVFKETISSVLSVALSANGEYIAAGTQNGEIRLWQAKDGRPIWTRFSHDRFAWALAFHPENKLLISGGYEGLVKVWEVSSGQCLKILQGHTAWIRSVAVHPDGKRAAACSDDGSIRLWDLTTGDCLRIWKEQSSGVWSVAFSPDGEMLASSHADGVVNIWNLAHGQRQWSSKMPDGSGGNSLAFSPDGEVLASGCKSQVSRYCWRILLNSLLAGGTESRLKPT